MGLSPALAEELFILYTLDDPYLRPHTLAVAEKTERLSLDLPISQRRLAVSLAYLHDVGKSDRLKNTGFHPLDGSLLALMRGDIELASLICHHSGARFEAARRSLSLPYKTPFGPVLDLVDVSDATTLPSGESCTPEERGRDIARRHGAGSPQALAFYDFLPQLELKARSLGVF